MPVYRFVCVSVCMYLQYKHLRSWRPNDCADFGQRGLIRSASPSKKLWYQLEVQIFLKSHYRHHTSSIEVGINTGILPACYMLYYCADLINTGNLTAACWYYRHTGNVETKFCISSTSHQLLVALRHERKKNPKII